VRDGLELKRLLLNVVRGEDLIEDDDSAVSIPRREHHTLAIR
jgi:hypothetical protein